MFSKFIRANNRSAEAAAASSPAAVAEPVWEERLQAAMGNDTDLLAVAKDAPSIDIKLSAVLALTGEDALRQAEREFRTHDRRVHRAVKQRYETQVGRREMSVRAEDLIRTAASLAAEATVPANHLVELDHAWRALDSGLLEEAQKTRFLDLQAGLAKRLREHSEHKRSVSRWSADARQVLTRFDAGCAGVANAALEPGELVAAFAAANRQAEATLAAVPAPEGAAIADADALAALDQALRAALQQSELIGRRLMILDDLQRGTAPQQTDVPDGAAATAPLAESPVQRWQASAVIADQGIENALNARFGEWQSIQDKAQRKSQSDRQQRADAKGREVHQERVQALAKVVSAAEEALAGGHLGEAVKHLSILQATPGNGEAGAALQARIDAAQAEVARLKGWQHWGGGQVRHDLVEEAEALARSVAVVEGARPAKLPVGQLEKNIERLRASWKELDRLGGATSKAIWQRFDSALKAAHVPVAEHLNRLNEARLANLTLRKALLDTLDAQYAGGDESGTVPDWKEVARVLAHFQSEWRKLGPLEHTVPHKKRTALMERMKASVARLEEPLHELQRGAQAEREQLIVRARQLSENAQNRDAVAKVRELQMSWQQHARSRPLPHRVENALWAEFKAATGAVMSRREEALKARNVQSDVNRKTREALLERLRQLGQDEPAAETRRSLAVLEAEWQKAGEVPGNQAARLDSLFRDGRDRALQYVAGSAQRLWHGTCDTLVAKLALCDETEALVPSAPADVSAIEARWAALPALPSRWEPALQARFKSAVDQAGGGRAAQGGETAACGGALDDLLLQLESALDMPSPAAFQAARRSLKLLAMKNAMEGRRPASPPAADIDTLSAAVFGGARRSVEQGQRVAAIVAVLRLSPPGSKGR